jgi:hypothetical protein
VIELDQELVTSLECPNCHTLEQVMKPMSEVTFEAGHCPTCGILRDAQFTHVITGEETFLHRTLSSVGIPPLHILRAQNGTEYRFYELTGDLPEALHFRHFERNGSQPEPLHIGERIRLKGEVHLTEVPATTPTPTRIRIKEETASKTDPIKVVTGTIKVKNGKHDKVKPAKISEPVSARIRYTSEEPSPRIKSKSGQAQVKVCKL